MMKNDFKPDLELAQQRWQAFFAGEIIDRPPVAVVAPRTGCTRPAPLTYWDKANGDLEEVIERGLHLAETTFWGGEAMPSFYPSIGPDEIAVFCGATLRWSPSSPDTNWSTPMIEDWQQDGPVRLDQEHPLFQRQQALYRRAAEVFDGRVLLVAPDLHSNMDLLAALRGAQRLCLDLIDQPEAVDAAMLEARQVFRELWQAIVAASRMRQNGACSESHAFYSMEGSATLQCDFSIMLSPRHFRRWVLPALEEEAALVKHALYHWDGFGALTHWDDLVHCTGLHTLSFVPGDGHGDPADHVDLLRKIQETGKSIHVWGTPTQCQWMHQYLLPERVFYCTQASSQSEAERLLDWFIDHT